MSELIQDRPMAAPDAADSSRSGRNHWFMVVAASALGGLILGGAYLFLFSGDDATTVEPIAAAPASSAAPAASGDAAGSGASGSDAEGSGEAAAADSSASPAAESAGEVTRTTVKMTSRDPFAPLVAKAADPAAGTADDSSKAAEKASKASDDAKSSDEAAAAPQPAKATGATITALKISPLGNSATLKLNGKKFEVEEGETFAKSYRLYDIFNADCAGFLYGDQNAVVCEGDSVQIG